ncbi:MAG: PPC domain-containing protein [Acidobacteria bacterium]|nr:PPC domain-containing protein [Acidobacteriota bacterium]
MKRVLQCLYIALIAIPIQALAQTTPPTVTFTTPSGIQRGATATFVVEGTGLEGATAMVFSEPGLSGKVVEVSPVPTSMSALEPKVVRSSRPYFDDPPPVQARVEISAESWMAAGTHQFRIITPNGSSTAGRIVVSPYPETREREPNDKFSEAQELALPMTVHGLLPKPGDTDAYRFQAKAGQEVVFLINAGGLGSRLDPVIEVVDASGKVIGSNQEERDRSSLGVKIVADGVYAARVSDYQHGGTIRHFYRLTLGQLPLLKDRYPLGLKTGTTRDFKIWGYNLGETKTAAPEPFGMMAGKVMDTGALLAQTKLGETVNTLPLAIGRFDEVEETGTNSGLQRAQELRYPITVNGRLTLDSSGMAASDYYRFTAKKGQKLILETAASRLGSPLDSVIEVLDATGKIVPRITARAVWKTQLTLRDRSSRDAGLRLFQPTGLELNDYMAVGGELLRIVRLTSAPTADEDIIFENFGGQRLAFEDTTPEARALDETIYKVELHPAGAQFPPNGMPIFRFNMRNDDGGPGYGTDSRVTFTAPADGTYYAKVTDVRSLGGDDYAYRFTIRDPQPDFLITASPTNPNIADGSSVAVEVTALRTEGFEGPIDLQFEGLPENVAGTRATIPSGENSVTLILSHKAGTQLAGGFTRYRITGQAKIGSETALRVANGGDYLKVIALMSKPDIQVTVKTPQLQMTPGGETKITLAVERHNGFKGRVLFRLNDLPFGVRPVNVGLNGIMIAENETERTFTLDSRPWVKPVTKSIYAVGIVEALVSTEHPSAPIQFQITGNERAAK